MTDMILSERFSGRGCGCIPPGPGRTDHRVRIVWRRSRIWPSTIGAGTRFGYCRNRECGQDHHQDLLAACLDNRSTLKTPGNYNNEIGLPLTLLGLNDEHRACVVELAIAPGEIAQLSRIRSPPPA